MKDFELKTVSKYYEFNDNIDYKRRNIDFNEYGFNKYEDINNSGLYYEPKTGPNCVKKPIKR